MRFVRLLWAKRRLCVFHVAIHTFSNRLQLKLRSHCQFYDLLFSLRSLISFETQLRKILKGSSRKNARLPSISPPSTNVNKRWKPILRMESERFKRGIMKNCTRKVCIRRSIGRCCKQILKKQCAFNGHTSMK